VHVFHTILLCTITGWPVHYPDIQHYKDVSVSSNTTIINATKFTQPHKFSMCQYCSMLSHQDPNDAVLNRHRWGLPPWSLECPLILSLTFPSDDTPHSTSYPIRSQINQLSMLLEPKPSLNQQGNKESKSHEWDLPLDFYRCPIL
jgi:hypothetical protein